MEPGPWQDPVHSWSTNVGGTFDTQFKGFRASQDPSMLTIQKLPRQDFPEMSHVAHEHGDELRKEVLIL
eukprot:3825132-Amphidinium_carterae.2